MAYKGALEGAYVCSSVIRSGFPYHQSDRVQKMLITLWATCLFYFLTLISHTSIY